MKRICDFRETLWKLPTSKMPTSLITDRARSDVKKGRAEGQDLSCQNRDSYGMLAQKH